MASRALERLRLKVERLRPRRDEEGERHRNAYQQPLVHFDVRPGELVLDVGCGNDPFPHATHLIDLTRAASRHRDVPLQRHSQPLAIADLAHLPFTDRTFGYIYCAHVLEHVDDPVTACGELMRVGARGYIETPNFMKDALFAHARGMHRWHVVGIASSLVFFEYSDRELDGVRHTAWSDVIRSRWHSPLQDLFHRNQDVFNTMFTWDSGFDVHVFRIDGSVEQRRR